MSASWTILCRVVDNYGDAGVCWRLARQLAREDGIDVTLLIDNLETLARLAPGVCPRCDRQIVDGATVQRLAGDLPPPAIWPDVIIDAFGGGLPETWLAALRRDFPAGEKKPRKTPPHWIILEYLTAETFADEMHGKPSPPPDVAVPRHFFFPGFTRKTGGLLREKNLLAERNLFLNASDAQRAFLERLGVHPHDLPPDALLVSLFCYDTPALPSLLDAWANPPHPSDASSGGSRPIVCLVPEGVAAETLRRWRAQHGSLPSERRSIRGALTLIDIPFLPQEQYDRLLWTCDLNFVRGEDSLVRALWSGKPFIWQAYRQSGQAHRAKIEAFLALYFAGAVGGAESNATDGTANETKTALRNFIRVWNNGPDTADIAGKWAALAAGLPKLETCTRNWARLQEGKENLLDLNLIRFCEACGKRPT